MDVKSTLKVVNLADITGATGVIPGQHFKRLIGCPEIPTDRLRVGHERRVEPFASRGRAQRFLGFSEQSLFKQHHLLIRHLVALHRPLERLKDGYLPRVGRPALHGQRADAVDLRRPLGVHRLDPGHHGPFGRQQHAAELRLEQRVGLEIGRAHV